ncbi:hypothetical protein RUND412_007298 [Rhizina undulata]
MSSASKTVTFDIAGPLRSDSPMTKYPYEHSPVLEVNPNVPHRTQSLGRSATPSSFSTVPSRTKLSGLASAKQKAKDAWSRYRDTPMEPEAETIPEYCMDSPTIPGRPALLPERSASAMGWRQLVYNETLVSPIDSPTIGIDFQTIEIDSPTIGEQSSQQRMGNPKIERPISPLALPQSPHTPWPETKEVPPKVPPKKSPTLQKAPAFLEKPSARLVKPPPLDRPRIFRPRADSAPADNAFSGPKSQLPVETTRPGSAHLLLGPLRTERDAEKRSHHNKRNISTALPHGLLPSQAVTQYALVDIVSLKKAAKQQSAKFDVLTPKDVDCLSRELSQLESRCQYLRETHKSLRAGRKTLHTRMITYLKSSRSGVFSRESLLKQEEALAELDAAIDDWQAKLEKAEERRNIVHQKLLEHVAAALLVPSGTMSSKYELVTPPTTPEKQKRHRTEKECITVYALLADVEQEMNRSVMARA